MGVVGLELKELGFEFEVVSGGSGGALSGAGGVMVNALEEAGVVGDLLHESRNRTCPSSWLFSFFSLSTCCFMVSATAFFFNRLLQALSRFFFSLPL